MRRALLALTTIFALSFGQGASTATADSNIDGEEIRAFDFGYNGAPQGDREAAPYSVVFTNTEKDPFGFHEIIFVRIARAHQRASKKDIIAAIDRIDFCPSGCFFDYIAGGAFAPAGTTTTSVGPNFQPGPVLLLRGRYAYFCGVTEADGTPHYKLGMFGTFWAK